MIDILATTDLFPTISASTRIVNDTWLVPGDCLLYIECVLEKIIEEMLEKIQRALSGRTFI